uniref:G0/G1 switch 2 n=1 Tax=Mastacembelus armatus TaxID=205130 RepID=A0A3Q3T314_9TELE
MENMQELIPFAREMLSKKPNRGMLKVYLVGSVFAVLGTVIGKIVDRNNYFLQLFFCFQSELEVLWGVTDVANLLW